MPLRKALKSAALVAWRRVPESVRHTIRPPAFEGSEAPASWYDEGYAKGLGHHTCHYTESQYYFVWSVIADRLRGASGVLEIGCGAGQLAELLADQGLERYVGFDFSAEAIKLARARCPQLDFRVEDARRTGLLDDASYDTIVCTEVLEHIEDDLQVVESIPSGRRVLATVPNFDSLSHVRFFENAEEAEARYRSLFSSVKTTTHLKARVNRFFLIDGVRA